MLVNEVPLRGVMFGVRCLMNSARIVGPIYYFFWTIILQRCFTYMLASVLNICLITRESVPFLVNEVLQLTLQKILCLFTVFLVTQK